MFITQGRRWDTRISVGIEKKEEADPSSQKALTRDDNVVLNAGTKVLAF
jgi:hypothetical protein